MSNGQRPDASPYSRCIHRTVTLPFCSLRHVAHGDEVILD
jgi:hypothetical protein